MIKDKHIYIIIGLLVLIALLLGGLYMERNKTARDLFQKASDNVVGCEEDIELWKTKYAAQQTSDAAKAELDSILNSCLGKIEAAKNLIN